MFIYLCVSFFAWPWLAKLKAIVVIPNFPTPFQIVYGKTVKVRITRATSLRYKNRPIKITMHLGLDIKINFKFTTNFDRCAILYVLNCCTKNFEPR